MAEQRKEERRQKNRRTDKEMAKKYIGMERRLSERRNAKGRRFSSTSSKGKRSQ